MPLLRQQFMSKRNHAKKGDMSLIDGLPSDKKAFDDIDTEQIDKLFKHNRTVTIDTPVGADGVPINPPKPVYSEQDISHFKNVVMQLLCRGKTDEVERMLLNAPPFNEEPGFTDAAKYKFSMFNRKIQELRETKICSPLAIAVNSGDINLVEIVLTHLHGVEIEFGLEVSTATPVHLQGNMFSNKRVRTPL